MLGYFLNFMGIFYGALYVYVIRPMLGVVWTDPVKPPSFLGSLFSRHKLETCQSFLLDPSALTFLFLLDPQTFLLDSAPHQCNV